MTRRIPRLALLAACLLTASPALASTMVAMSVPKLTEQSDSIVRGKVQSVQSRWTRDNRRIVTEVTIKVDEALAGTPGATITLVELGGTVGEIGMKVGGSATFTPGEETVLFVQRLGKTKFGLVGMAQGKFKVERSSDGKAVFAVPEVHDARMLDAKTGLEATQATQPIALDELRRVVRATKVQQKSLTPAPKRTP